MQFDVEIFNPQEANRDESLRYQVKNLNRFAALDVLDDRRNKNWAGEDIGEHSNISAKDGLTESVQNF
jgi:hypothetical protein